MKAQIVTGVLYGMFQKGRLAGRMQKQLDKKSLEERAYMEPMLKMFGAGNGDMRFVQKQSIRNQFYSEISSMRNCW